jgi:hypothetical protein
MEKKLMEVRDLADCRKILLANVTRPRPTNQVRDQRVESAETKRNAGPQFDCISRAFVLVEEVEALIPDGLELP